MDSFIDEFIDSLMDEFIEAVNVGKLLQKRMGDGSIELTEV